MSGRPDWVLVLPVKCAATAKSRLVPPDGVSRVDLARAIALDSVSAAARAPGVSVVVVTADAEVAAGARALGGRVVTETAAHGLPAAIAAGVATIARPGSAGAPCQGAGVLLADVPALRPTDLATALVELDEMLTHAPMAFVPDAEGTGTVLLAARSADELRPAFGPSSARAHTQLGARPVRTRIARLQRDVDTAGTLLAAARLGLGRHTAALVGDRLSGGSHSRRLAHPA